MTDSCLHLDEMQLTVVEDVHTILVGDGLHGNTHPLKLLVGAVSCEPAHEF